MKFPGVFASLMTTMLALATIIVAALPSTHGFTATLPLSPLMGSGRSTASAISTSICSTGSAKLNHHHHIQGDAKKRDESNETDDYLLSARTARIGIPLKSLALGLASASLLPLPAYAGIGSVVPFDVTLKQDFRGSITNSVVLLRLAATLRKSGYYEKKSQVATYSSNSNINISNGVIISDLVADVTRKFGDGRTVFELPTNTPAFLEAAQGKRAMIVYGPEVSISAEGVVVNDVRAGDDNDLAAVEKKIVDQLVGKLLRQGGIMEVTLLGGTIIHRPKTGGKAAGEDCFQPSAITTWKVNSNAANSDGAASGLSSTDLFEKVFGDLPTPRQTKVLR